MAPDKTTSTEPLRRSERVQVATAIEKSRQESRNRVSKPKRFRRPRQRMSCRLLALPGELRNRIYRHALVQSNDVRVTKQGPGQPALLKVCRRVRQEASGIYYTENKFVLNVEDYNGAAFLPFARQIERFPLRQVFFAYDGDGDWDNLVSWLKAHNNSAAMIPTAMVKVDPDLMDSDDCVMAGALKIVDAMKWLPWEFKQEALEGFYLGIRGTCSSWVHEGDKIDHW